MSRSKFDWKKYTKEFVRGNFKTVSEYVRYSERMRTVEGEKERPKKDSINKMSKRLNWLILKEKREEKQVQKIVNNGLEKVSKKEIQKMIDSKTAVNNALLKVIVHYANNPEQLQVKADFSDIINDAKRGLGMVTKESQQGTAPPTNLTQVNIDSDSFRSQLEQAEPEKMDQIEKGVDDELDNLLSQIPVSKSNVEDAIVEDIE